MEAQAGVEMKENFWLTGQCFPVAPKDDRKRNYKISALSKKMALKNTKDSTSIGRTLIKQTPKRAAQSDGCECMHSA